MGTTIPLYILHPMWELYIHFGLLLANLLIWAIGFRHYSYALKLLGVTLLVTLLLEGYAAYLMLEGIRNLYVYHLLTPLQYALYAFLFYLMAGSSIHKRLILFSIPLFALVSFLLSGYVQQTNEFNSYALSLKNILLVGWALLYYRDVFMRLRVNRLETEPFFWVSTGLLFYSLGCFFVYGFMNQLIKTSHQMTLTLYYITLFLGYLLYITFAVAFVLHRKKTQPAL